MIMKAGMFGRGGSIALWVDESGWVINGGYSIDYHAETDEISFEYHERMQRVCDVNPQIVKEEGGRFSYNGVMEEHRRYETKPELIVYQRVLLLESVLTRNPD